MKEVTLLSLVRKEHPAPRKLLVLKHRRSAPPGLYSLQVNEIEALMVVALSCQGLLLLLLL